MRSRRHSRRPRRRPSAKSAERSSGVTGVRISGTRECQGQPVWSELDGNSGRRPKNRALRSQRRTRLDPRYTPFSCTAPTTSHASSKIIKSSSFGGHVFLTRAADCDYSRFSHKCTGEESRVGKHFNDLLRFSDISITHGGFPNSNIRSLTTMIETQGG